jgi:uncharacterized protein (DUF362 family)
VFAAVRSAMERAEWEKYVPTDSPVALKPNLCWDLPLPGAQTSPWVFDAVISILKERTRDIVVVESDQITVNVLKALQRTGLGAVVEKHGLRFINMTRDVTYVRKAIPDPFVLPEIEVPDVLTDRLLITIPVLKTHGTTRITGALKNQWGCLRELRHNYHLVVDDAIADLNDALRPVFAVMDGTVGMEGSGPKTGLPKVADLILASSDLVALDTIASLVMGIDPSTVGHIQRSADRGLGVSDLERIDVVGAKIEECIMNFKPPKQNFMVRFEFFLRRSRFRRLAFETSVLNLLAFAARVWNHAWWQLVGRRERKRIIEDTFYGKQWKGTWKA